MVISRGLEFVLACRLGLPTLRVGPRLDHNADIEENSHLWVGTKSLSLLKVPYPIKPFCPLDE